MTRAFRYQPGIIIATALLAVSLVSTANAQKYDFIFNLKNALEPHAEKYVVESRNVKIFHEPFHPLNSYWGAEKNDLPGVLTFRFPLEKPLASGRIMANLATANFENSKTLGKGKGELSLWCSRDGKSWQLLTEMKPPRVMAFDGIDFHEKLPRELVGSREIWLQVRFLASGMVKKTYSVAQFCRDNCSDPKGTTFDIRVRYMKTDTEFVTRFKNKSDVRP